VVTRSEKVVVKGLNRDGRPVRYHASDLFAEAIEHEVDHLNGILYFDYLKSMEELTPYTARDDEDEDGQHQEGHDHGAHAHLDEISQEEAPQGS
jgi:peptide deformylase